MTKAGVFDEFDKNRGKIFHSITKLIQYNKNINDDRDNNQSSLFENSENFGKDFEFLPAKPWLQKEILNEEFKSLGFFISDHPLNEFSEIFKQLNIISYDDFYHNSQSEGMVAGTIMSIQEKKSSKGTPYAILKLSDNKEEFELFLFSEILISNRDKLTESDSIVLTLQKDKNLNEGTKKRINVRKILSVNEVIDKPYSKVTIELSENFKIDEIKQILSSMGDTQIDIIINNENKKVFYTLENKRNFDLKHYKALKGREYVSKITV